MLLNLESTLTLVVFLGATTNLGSEKTLANLGSVDIIDFFLL